MFLARKDFCLDEIKKSDDFVFRSVVFGVVFDTDKNIGVYVVCEDPYILGLPGGGIEKGETPTQALERESVEELGVMIKVQKKMFDYEDFFEDNKGYKGFFFLCKRIGQGGEKPVFREDGTKRIVHWLPVNQFIKTQTLVTKDSKTMRGKLELFAVKEAVKILQ
jgi:8-oxo-dGTP pyrophosphatase MutT (NUDIX family)